MIISHKHKYIFVELPRTGSTAISDQLVRLYDGEKILIKHASYRNFQKFYKDKYKDYYVFSCIRHPMDRIISIYIKLKNEDHVNSMEKPMSKKFYKRKIDFLKNNSSFEDYFLRFYKLPYDDWGSLDHKKFNAVIRFESLQEDFKTVLKELNIEQVQDIPMINRTKKKKNYLDYYTPRIQKRAKYVFSSYCLKNGYSTPWDDDKVSKINNLIYNALYPFRKIFWINSKNYFIKNKMKLNKNKSLLV